MRKEYLYIDDIPAVLLGEPSEKVYLFVHGKDGNKEEAIEFAKVVNPKGYEVLGIDLQKHKDEEEEDRVELLPWKVIPKIKKVKDYLNSNWKHIYVRANSIGAWFTMLSFESKEIEKCLFVSPILNMERLINDMMLWANVTEEDLKRKNEVKTNFGQTLSLEYLNFAKQHIIKQWNCPTEILYAGKDNLTSRETLSDFVKQFKCGLTIMEDGEHWFHTPTQCKFMSNWENEKS